jgi:hypothetical protein
MDRIRERKGDRDKERGNKIFIDRIALNHSADIKVVLALVLLALIKIL